MIKNIAALQTVAKAGKNNVVSSIKVCNPKSFSAVELRLRKEYEGEASYESKVNKFKDHFVQEKL